MWRNLASNALTLFIALLLLAGGMVIWGKGEFTNPGPLEQAICLRVESGSNMRRVSNELADQGAISSPGIFRAGADYTDKASQLKAGSYLVEPGASMESIIDTITRSGRSTCGTEVNFRIGVLSAKLQVRELDPATNRYVEVVAFEPGVEEVPAEYTAVTSESDTRYRVTLAEGVTSWQVVEELKEAEFLTGSVEVPAEGALAPDSYEVVRGSERAALIARMEESQAALLAELWQARDEDLPLASPEEAMVLASIVEKETGVPEERRQVASVFVNRLRQGIRLQTDPTVIYGITNGQGALGRGIRQSELRRATPYNTYVIEGLPPTPIANPGRASIEAALHPDTTDYIFFVADGTGGHAFAVTLEEHNRNVAEWRKIEAERANQ
ncbi:endolytic transglycosylase MltG [Actibacterium lipolyticum]|uniref:Endolytic murein transglycosylase n=1 Tax=Actibacterium lipolyticum TaxID=1524263 RepID=A0A238KHA0_9RHOB|nr:endolytic transglycosylase MltG [Actibacterium lipolyticum]SMX42110.1 putative aminodeoxychorismate lyase [Actibacterium lipolyticum]